MRCSHALISIATKSSPNVFASNHELVMDQFRDKRPSLSLELAASQLKRFSSKLHIWSEGIDGVIILSATSNRRESKAGF